jgi:hypothetical protein
VVTIHLAWRIAGMDGRASRMVSMFWTMASSQSTGPPFRTLSRRSTRGAMSAAGLTCVTLGPFHHAGTVPGAGGAAAVLTTLYRVAFGAIVTAVVGDGLPATDIAPRVDLRLKVRRGGPVDWLDAMVQNIDTIRDARLSMPAMRHAR